MHVKPAGKAAMIFAVVAVIGIGAWKTGILDKVDVPPVTQAQPQPQPRVVVIEPAQPTATAAQQPANPQAAEPQPTATVTSGDAGMNALLKAGKK